MNTLRLESGFRHWGHDISDEDTPLEAGLGFAVAWDKPGGFLGRRVLEAQRAESVRVKRLVQLRITDSSQIVYHDEPIRREGVVVGRVTSGMYGHTFGACLAMGYLYNQEGVTKEWIESGSFDIEVASVQVPADAQIRPFYQAQTRS